MADLKTVILSGGRGFRLNPLTLERPKALCPIGNVSLLRRLLDQLLEGGITQAVVTLPSTAKELKSAALAQAPCGFQLDVAFSDDENAGQVGGVRQIVGSHEGPILVIYGDSLLSADFRSLVDAHGEKRLRGGLATVLYHRPADLRIPEKDGRTYHGVLSIDGEGRITRFEEKPLVTEIRPGFERANAAVFVIEAHLLSRPEFECARNFSFHIFQPALSRGLPIYACDIGNGFRFDVGGVERWFELNMKAVQRSIGCPLPASKLQSGIWCADETVEATTVFVAPVLLGRKVLTGTQVKIGPNVILGDGCQVGDGASIRDSVIMECCEIGARVLLDHCVIGPYCRIAADTQLPKFTCLGAYSTLGGGRWVNWAAHVGYGYGP